MFKVSPLLFVCVTVLFSLTATEKEYDHLLLVVQWPPGLCFPKGCNSVPEHWTIHGLWPSASNAKKPWPVYCIVPCPKPNFNKLRRDVKLYDNMKSQWKSFTRTSSSEPFWRDEYCKHGTCCADMLPEPADYFRKTIDLHKRYTAGIKSELENKENQNMGITPSVKRRYSFTALEQALGGKLERKTARYWCKKEGEKQYLYQMGVCFNKPNGVNGKFVLTNCPSGDFKNSCDTSTNKLFYLLPANFKQFVAKQEL